MIGKKINQLATELAPASTDLTIIGNPTTGVSKKITLAQLGAIFSGAVSFYNDLASFPATGTLDVIFCAKDTQKLYLWSGSAYVEVFPSQALLDTYQLRSEKGVSNGYASLDSSGKVPISQLPSSIMEYKGTWNAATNTPTLANGTGDTGDVYICNVAGTVNFGAGPLTFAVGDYVIYSGSIWQRSSGAVGTVTSVAASITGNAIGITGSPVTTSGTLALAFAGTSAQYVNGAGNLTTFPSLTGFVPYTGATTNVDLGTYGLTSDYLALNTSPTSVPTNVGVMAWNDTDGTMDIKLKGGNVTLQVGQEQVVRVVNKTGASLLEANYQVVRVRSVSEGGAQGQRLAVVLAQGDSAAHSKGVLGLVTETIADNQEGFITILGQVHEIDTTGTLQGETWVDGDKLYLSATTAGKLTNVAPTAPNHSVIVGYVEYAHAIHGKIFVNVNEGSSLDELHNVYAPSPTSDQSIYWNTATSRYENNTIAGILGYTPQAQLNGTGFVKASGTTITYDNSTYLTTSAAATTYLPMVLSSTANFVDINGQQFSIYGSAGGFTSGRIIVDPVFSAIGYQNAGVFDGLKILTNGNAEFSNSGVTRFFNQVRFDSTLTNGTYTYTLPSATGTIALVGGAGVGTVTSVGLSSATSGVTIGSSPVTTSGTITLAIATASGSQQGLLSSTDWTTFNNKQNALTNPVTGTGTTNYLPKFTGTSTIGDSQVFDNGTNVGIGTNSPNALLEVTSRIVASNGGGASRVALNIESNGIGTSYSAINSYNYGTAAGRPLAINESGGNVMINTTTDSGYKLDVNGTGRFANAVNVFGANLAHAANKTTLSQEGAGNGAFWQSYGTDASTKGKFTLRQYSSDASISGIPLSIDQTGAATFSSSVTAGGNITGNGVTIGASDVRSSSNILTLGGTSEVIRIAGSTGSVGIGTTSPTQGKLVVSGGVANSIATIAASISGGSNALNIGDDGTNAVLGVANSGTDMVFLKRVAGVYSEAMRITSGGNVGIGTTSPSAVLEVAGTSANTDFRISRTVSSSTYFYIKAPGGSPSTATMGVNGVDVMALKSNQVINFVNVPTSSAGLSSGDIYKTVAGVLMIV